MEQHSPNKKDSTKHLTDNIIHHELNDAFSNHNLGSGTYNKGNWEITITHPESLYLFKIDLSSIIANAINQSIQSSDNGNKYTLQSPFPSITYHRAQRILKDKNWGEELTSENLEELASKHKNKPLFIVSHPLDQGKEFDPNPYEPKIFSQRIDLYMPKIGIIGKGGKINNQYKFSLDASKLEQYIMQAYN